MNTQSLHALVVDDDRPYSILLKTTLTGRGHTVIVCNSAQDAFKHLQNETFDIVLLDYKMEGISGINVLQWIYGQKINIPVVLITGYGSEEIYEEAYKWGASEYFVKGEMDAIRLPVMIEQAYTKYQAQRKRVK